jgi:ribosomal protein L37AE/L43A
MYYKRNERKNMKKKKEFNVAKDVMIGLQQALDHAQGKPGKYRTHIVDDCKHKEKKGNKYKCNKCGKIVTRNSTKVWINSYCDDSGKTTRLYKIRRKDEIK